MSIVFPSETSLDLVQLQQIVTQKESSAPYRLKNLGKKEEEGHPFNVHEYIRVKDKKAPLSKLFRVAGEAGNAEDDPVVKTWLAQHPGQRIVCANEVYVSDSSGRIAVVGKPD